MRRLILSTAFLGFAAVAPLSAQAPAGAGWSAFAGCWTPVGADGSRNVAANTPRVCVVPDQANGAELLTVISDSITARTPIAADGRERPVSKQGCSGWEKAEFSADGRRLYLRSQQTCAGGVQRTTSGIFAIANNGEWVSAVDVSADSASSVRVTRYAAVAPHATLPASIRETLAAREMSDRTARVAAQRDVSINAVIEASRFLSTPAQEAWLAELQQDFNLDDRALTRLADEKVPPSVIDMMVAVSNPGVFSVQPTGAIEREQVSRVSDRDRSYGSCFAPIVDPWAWYAYDPCDPFLRFGYYNSRYYRYGYGRYGYGYGYYDPFYGGFYDGYYGRRPVIVVRGAPEPRGRMTPGGYKRDNTSTPSGSSSPRATTSRGSDGSSSSSGSSGSSSSGGSGSSSGRTATRKPPG